MILLDVRNGQNLQSALIQAYYMYICTICIYGCMYICIYVLYVYIVQSKPRRTKLQHRVTQKKHGLAFLSLDNLFK